MSESHLGDKVLSTFGWTMPRGRLVRLQLGDLFFRGENDPVFLVINAGCDLMFTPATVSDKRPAEPSNTIYLLPGELCATTDIPPKGLTTGLIWFDTSWRCIVWDSKKVVAIPHGMIEHYLRKQNYRHELRLSTSRAIELQQQVFYSASRIGLEVQPPISDELDLRIIVRKAGGFESLDTIIHGGAVRFHTPKQTVVVLKPSAITTACDRLVKLMNDDEASKPTRNAIENAEAAIRSRVSAIAKTPFKEPASNKPDVFKPASKFTGVSLHNVGIVSWAAAVDTSTWNQSLAVVFGIEDKA